MQLLPLGKRYSAICMTHQTNADHVYVPPAPQRALSAGGTAQEISYCVSDQTLDWDSCSEQTRCHVKSARLVKERGEVRPPWIAHLSTNLKVYFRRSAEWLARDSRPIE